MKKILLLPLLVALCPLCAEEATKLPQHPPETTDTILALADPDPETASAAAHALLRRVTQAGAPGAALTPATTLLDQLLQTTQMPGYDRALPPASVDARPNGLLALVQACRAWAEESHARSRLLIAAWRHRLYCASLLAPPEAAPAFAPALRNAHHQAVFEAALAAMQRIPGDAAVAALLNAAPELPPERHRLLLLALAAQPLPQTRGLFETHARNTADPDRWRWLQALARLGHSPEEVIEEKQLTTNAEKTRFANAALAAAHAQLRQGNPQAAEKRFLHFMNQYTTRHQQRAALAGLARLNAKKLLPIALAFLNTPNVQPTALAVLIQTQAPDTEKTLKNAYKNADDASRALLLKAFAARNSQELPNLLEDAYTDAAAIVRFTAAQLSALDPLPEDALELAIQGPFWIRNQALRAYLDLAHANAIAGAQEEAANQFRTIIDLEISTTITREALDGLASVGDPSDLEALANYADHPDYLEQAANAIATILARQPPSPEQQEQLIHIAKTSPHERAAAAAAQGLTATSFPPYRLAQQRGYITDWKVLGPFPLSEEDSLNTAFFPEARDEMPEKVLHNEIEFSWRAQQTEGIPATLTIKEGSDENDAIIYCFCRIILPEWRPAQLQMNPAFPCHIRLNAQTIYTHPPTPKSPQNTLEIPAVFKKGVNRLLLKVRLSQQPAPFSLRILDRDGAPLDLSRQKLPDDGAKGVGVGAGAAKQLAGEALP